ncbi:hypothetical protein [Phycicoccus avicenniae]|uniref:hypothetical protein n=1 Tax=Phycicoccus avicenniae TaxID=2828860 RepID=UPI003D26CE08
MLGDPAPLPFDPVLLRSTRSLRATGVDPTRGGWHHVRYNAWVELPVWRSLTPEQQHAALVHATDLGCREPGRHVYVLESAAAVWGLPRVGPWPEHVTVLATGPRTRGSRCIRVHVGAPLEAVDRDGVRVSDPARTVVDLARTCSLETALCAADHALRHGLCTVADLDGAAAEVAPRVRGRPAARLVAALADGRSMSPGESFSRARMFQLELPRPQLQVPLEDDDGWFGHGDFGWPGVVGEFDGRRKYAVPEGATGEEAERVLWSEKRREDRIRRRSRLARWVWQDVARTTPMLLILAEQGIRPQPRPVWVDLSRPPAA